MQLFNFDWHELESRPRTGTCVREEGVMNMNGREVAQQRERQEREGGERVGYPMQSLGGLSRVVADTWYQTLSCHDRNQSSSSSWNRVVPRVASFPLSFLQVAGEIFKNWFNRRSVISFWRQLKMRQREGRERKGRINDACSAGSRRLVHIRKAGNGRKQKAYCVQSSRKRGGRKQWITKLNEEDFGF